jgi:hypothetical protein
MIERFLRGLSSIAGMSAALTLLVAALALGCNQTESRASGHVDVVSSPATAAWCPDADRPLSGNLELVGLRNEGVTSVSGEELWRGSPTRRELPAGLYAVSWTPSPSLEESEGGAWMLRSPVLVNVFSGQVTIVSVRTPGPACSLSPLSAS